MQSRNFLICSPAGLETGPDNKIWEGPSIVLGALKMRNKWDWSSLLFKDANPEKGHLKRIHLPRRPEFYCKYWGKKFEFLVGKEKHFSQVIFHIFHLTKLQLHSKS